MALLAAGVLTIAYGSGHTADYVGHTLNELQGADSDGDGVIDNIELGRNNCAWTTESRCNQCVREYFCGAGEYVAGVRHVSSGETHLDSVQVYCCSVK
ncbi:hypothetical protein GOV04_02285 [Candidatus Woesearchaeota archaeon]|nr:hypothetical protein [Candidatus Woesearchaeota archaeon]